MTHGLRFYLDLSYREGDPDFAVYVCTLDPVLPIITMSYPFPAPGQGMAVGLTLTPDIMQLLRYGS